MKDMIEKSENYYEGDSESDYSYANYGLLLKLPIDAMPVVLTKLKEIPGVRVIYQRKSVGPLRILDSEH